jgi:transcription elongation factor Elf1
MWTEEQRKAASERAKARWADPEYKKKQGKAISKTPQCPSCGETNIKKFYVDKIGRRTNKYCRKCHAAACNKRWHDSPALTRWASRNSHKYGVTKEFLLELNEKQNGKCAICGGESKNARRLHIDHCHKTGTVRGLLCQGCNLGIGHLLDDVEVINKAIEYLRRNHGKPQYR